MIFIGIDLVSPHNLLFLGEPVWTKYTVSYSDLSAAALTKSITIATVPAKTVLHAVGIKHSASFTGGAIATYTLEVGITGTTARYASPFNVLQAPGDTVGQISGGTWSEDFANPVAIKLTATSTGANLDQATAGSATIWLYTSVLP